MGIVDINSLFLIVQCEEENVNLKELICKHLFDQIADLSERKKIK